MPIPTQVRVSFAILMMLQQTPILRAQGVSQGTALAPAMEVRAIVAGLRAVAVEERLELGMERICRIDVTHPDCPRDLKATQFKGRLPGQVWVQAKRELNDDEKVGKHKASVFKASIAYVQRPVALGDSIVMLVQMLRRVEGAPRDLLYFDVVLQGDSTNMTVRRSTQRPDKPVK